MGNLMNKMLQEMQPNPNQVPIRWPLSPNVKVAKSQIEDARRVLCTPGMGKETLTLILALLGHGTPAHVYRDIDPIVVSTCQDIAKGILDLCGMTMTIDGLIERELHGQTERKQEQDA